MAQSFGMKENQDFGALFSFVWIAPLSGVLRTQRTWSWSRAEAQGILRALGAFGAGGKGFPRIPQDFGFHSAGNSFIQW